MSTTSCHETRRQLLELAVADIPEVEHLGDCPDCRAFADRIIRQEKTMYQTIGSWVDRDDVPHRVLPGRRWGATRLLQAAVLLLAIGGALWLGLSPGMERQRPAEPPPPVAEQRLDLLEIPVGRSAVLQPPGTLSELQQDPEVFEVNIVGPLLQIVGVAEGEGMLTIGVAERSERMRYRVVVSAPDAPTGDADIVLRRGGVETLALPEPPTAFSVSAEHIATLEAIAETELQLEALEVGATDVVLVFGIDAPPVIYTVEVTD